MTNSRLQARIESRIPDRKMVHHLSLLSRELEITVHVFVIERPDASRSQPERFCGEIQPLSYGACLEMDIAITTFTMNTGGAIEIPDHRKRHAGVAREILSQTQTRGRNALVATHNLLQFAAFRPEPVHAR